jgi:hypothetical protein
MPTQPRSRQTVKTDPTPDAIRIVPLPMTGQQSCLTISSLPCRRSYAS